MHWPLLLLAHNPDLIARVKLCGTSAIFLGAPRSQAEHCRHLRKIPNIEIVYCILNNACSIFSANGFAKVVEIEVGANEPPEFH
jgi:hypothetical protein